MKRRYRIALVILIVWVVFAFALVSASGAADPHKSCACQGPPVATPTLITIAPRP